MRNKLFHSHRIPGWFGMERTPNPIHGGDISQCPTPVSSLALGTARDPRAATANLGIPSQPSQGTIPAQNPIQPCPGQCETIPCVLALCSAFLSSAVLTVMILVDAVANPGKKKKNQKSTYLPFIFPKIYSCDLIFCRLLICQDNAALLIFF